MQFKVEGIHLCYHDTFSNPTEPFSIGLQISEVGLQDSSNDSATKIQSSLYERCLQMKALRIYRRTGIIDSTTPPASSESKDILCETDLIASLSFSNESDGTVHLDSIRCDGENIKLAVTPMAMSDLSNLAAVLEHRNPRILYITKRPCCSYKGNSKAWWKYAMSCVLEIVHRERVARSPQAVSVRVRDLLQYRCLYSKHFDTCLKAAKTTLFTDAETKEDRAKREDLEVGLPGPTVIAIRDAVMRQNHPRGHREAGGCGFEAIKPWWRMSLEHALNQKAAGLIKPILEAVTQLLATDKSEEEQLVNRECKLSWKVASIGIELWDAKRRNGIASGPEQRVASVTLAELAGSCAASTHSLHCIVGLGSLLLEHHGTPAPVEPIIVSRPFSSSNESSLLHFEWNLKRDEDSGKLYVAMSAHIQRLELVNSPPFTQILIPFQKHLCSSGGRSPPFFTTDNSKVIVKLFTTNVQNHLISRNRASSVASHLARFCFNR